MRRDNTSTWTLDNALRMQTTLAQWLRTPEGAKCAYAIEQSYYEADPDNAPPSWDRARREARETAATYSNPKVWVVNLWHVQQEPKRTDIE